MPSIDIPIDASLQEAFDLPSCDALKLPMPSPLQIQLPTGGSINALVDVSQGIPNDCAMSFNLMLQLQPLLVAIECPMRMLKLLKPLVDIISDLSSLTPPSPMLMAEFAEAAAELAPCFASIAGIPLFIEDVLCLIRSVLNCLIGQMQTVRDLMNGLALRLGEAEGNEDLLNTLQCAQDNAAASMANMTSAIDPIAGLLALVAPIMGIAGQDLSIELVPPTGSAEDAAAIDAVIATLQTAVDAIDTATGGSCG